MMFACLRVFVMKNTSVKEMGRRGKRRDSKISVMICLGVFHGQTIGKCEGTSDGGRQDANATVLVEEEGREGSFRKVHADV